MSASSQIDCKQVAGVVRPLIDLSACEGKQDCVPVCPYDVFEMRPITQDEYKTLSLRGRIKTWVHGREKAFAVRADACHACGLCVTACPEKAIRLTKFT